MSVAASQGLPDKPTIFATTGTAAHTVSEWCREQRVGAEKFLGTIIRVKNERDIVCDQDMVDGVNAFCEYVYDLGGDMFFEIRVHYEQYVRTGFGTSDHVAVVREFDPFCDEAYVCHIVDFKYGEGVQVWAEKEPQLMLYALGFMLDYGWLYPQIDRFVLHISQPRLNHIDRWEISREDLLAWAETVVRVRGALAVAGEGEFKAGPWCQFCRARFTCGPRFVQIMSDIAGYPLTLEEALEFKMPDISRLSNEDIDKILHRLPELKMLMADAKAHAVSEIRQGRPVGGWKFVPGRSDRQFTERPEAVAEILEVPATELYDPPSFMSPAKVEKTVGKKKFKLWEWLLVRKTQGAPTLAPEFDRREAITPIAEEFEDLDANQEDLFDF
jgi:hypothetical protein